MCRSACVIQDGETGVLTGGGYPVTDKVSRYNRDGLVEYLPNLNTERWAHACSSLEKDGETVSLHYFSVICTRYVELLIILVKVYLVVGGLGGGNNALASTELFMSGAWMTVDPLPAALRHLRAITIQNVVYVSGE